MGARVGKLIKKDEKEFLDSLGIESYPWLNFNEHSVVFTDNSRRSIVSEKMHDPLELQEKINVARDFKKPLAERSTPIFPTDMTLDFEKGHRDMIKRRRRTMMDEEEAMAMELAEMEHPELHGAASNSDHLLKFVPDEPIKPGQAQASPIVKNPVSIANHGADTPKTSEHFSHTVPTVSPEEIKKIKETAQDEGKNEGMILGKEQGYKEGYEKGFDHGAQEGFKSGEERGMAAVESKYNRAFENISEAAVRMENLKNSILLQGKEIFIELAKITCEKIIKEQLNSSDESLSKLFDALIKNYDSKNPIKIEMNSVDAKRLKKHIDIMNIESKITIKENDTLENGAFYIEGDSGISQIDIKKSVESVIDKLKDELFSNKDSEILEEQDSEIKGQAK